MAKFSTSKRTSFAETPSEMANLEKNELDNLNPFLAADVEYQSWGQLSTPIFANRNHLNGVDHASVGMRLYESYSGNLPQQLSSYVPNLEEDGLDMLSQMLEYEPSQRISAKKAMEHCYFDNLDVAPL